MMEYLDILIHNPGIRAGLLAFGAAASADYDAYRKSNIPFKEFAWKTAMKRWVAGFAIGFLGYYGLM